MGDWIEFQTQNNLHYVFIPESSGAVQIKVKAANDAHIALTNEPCDSNPITEIFIGSTNSLIRKEGRECVSVISDGILNGDEYTSLYIQWHNNEVSAGLRGRAPFIKYTDPSPHTIRYIGVRTGRSAIGSWKIEVSPSISRSLSVKPVKGGELRWVEKTRDDPLPPDAFIGGYEDGEVLYIARGVHGGELIPGKYIHRLRCAIVGTHLHLHRKETCEILCGYNASWVKTSLDFIPPHVFITGAHEANGEPLFIGRARFNHNLVPGKVNSNHKTSYIPYHDTERRVEVDYEILVLPEKLPSAVVWRPKVDINDHPRRRSYLHPHIMQHRHIQHGPPPQPPFGLVAL